MNLFSGFRGKRLELAWEFTAGGIIWRLLPSDAGYFVGEERDVSGKSVSFFCLERKRGMLRWNQRDVGTQWWISLDAVHDRTVFLHEFATPDMPDKKKILALDLDSGAVRWTNEEARFLFAHDGAVYASMDGLTDRQFLKLDLETGKILSEVEAGYLNVLRETAGSRFDQITFPRGLDPTIHGDESLARSIDSFMPAAKREACLECLDVLDSTAVSIYENTGGSNTQESFRQHLVVFGKENGEMRYKDVLVEKASAQVPDTFFQWHDFIYYIKEKRILRALDLSTAGS